MEVEAEEQGPLIENPSMAEEPSENPNSFNKNDLLEALEMVERDSLAIADSYTSLFASLRLTLSEGTTTSTDHIQCFSDAAGKLQESAIDSATKGNRFIHSCVRLNEEMKGIDGLASQLITDRLVLLTLDLETIDCLPKMLKKNVDTLDSAVSRLLRIT